MRTLCLFLFVLIGCTENQPPLEIRAPLKVAESASVDDLEPSYEVEIDVSPFQEMIDALVDRQKTGAYPSEMELAADQLYLDYHQGELLMKNEVSFHSDSLLFTAKGLRGKVSDERGWQSFILEGQAWIQNKEMGTATADKVEVNIEDEIVYLEGQANMKSEWGSLSGESIEVYIDGSRQVHSQQGAIQLIQEGGEIIDVQADTLIWNALKQSLACSTNVVVTQQDRQMRADWLEVSLKDSNEIDWLKAGEQVSLEAESMSARADRMQYESRDDFFVLTGSVQMYQGSNKVIADTVFYWPSEGRLRCEPQAKVWFYPVQKGKDGRASLVE